MMIENVKNKIKCDGSGCKNLSDIVILNKRFVFDGKFYLCKNCATELFKELSKVVVPKSPEPIFKKKGVKNEEE